MSVNHVNRSELRLFDEEQYNTEIESIFNKFPSYQTVGGRAYKPGLDGMNSFDRALGSPHKKFLTIHVAGTNGKGSVSHLLASVLAQAGLKTGLYTSPHLLDFRERIRVNGEMISKEDTYAFLSDWKSFMEEEKLSFFEITTAMAFDYFAKKEVDIAVIETGLGGRLDSTNIITPILSIITNISFDHKAYLGETIGEIALEKAGIIKPFVPVVVGEYIPETKTIFEEVAARNSSKLVFAQLYRYKDVSIDDYELDLKGAAQIHNLRTVLTAISQLADNVQLTQLMAKECSDASIRQGLKCAAANTGLRGRWEYLSKDPAILCDVAHNEDGLRYAFRQLATLSRKRLFITIGFVADKELKNVLGLLPMDAFYFFSAPNSARALPAEDLAEMCRGVGLSGVIFNSIAESVSHYRTICENGDLLFIVGSNFVVSEALALFPTA